MTNDQDLCRVVATAIGKVLHACGKFEHPPGTPWTDGHCLLAANAALDALIAHHKPGPFTGDEAEVRARLRGSLAHPDVVREALALLDAKDAEIARLREKLSCEAFGDDADQDAFAIWEEAHGAYDTAMAEKGSLPNKAAASVIGRRLKQIGTVGAGAWAPAEQLTEALARAEQAEAALAERDKAIAEALRIAENMNFNAGNGTCVAISQTLRVALPKQEVDPLVEAVRLALHKIERDVTVRELTDEELRMVGEAARNLEVRAKGEG